MDFEKEAQRYPFDLSLVSFASDDQEYVVAFKDYPDIIGSGVSAEEAMAEAYDNLAVYLEYLSDEGKTIVAPRVKESGEEPSGRVTLRMSKTLHAALIKRAEKESMSVNSIVNEALAKYLYQSRQEGWNNFDSLVCIVNSAFKAGLHQSGMNDDGVVFKPGSHQVKSTINVCSQSKASYNAA